VDTENTMPVMVIGRLVDWLKEIENQELAGG
jgi:hypothetical protein